METQRFVATRWLGQVPWGRLALEMFSVVVGVLIALWLSNWNDRRKEHVRAHEALAEIRRELAGNRDRLNESARYYRTLLERVNVAGGAGLARFQALPEWKGVSPPLLNDSVFSAAMTTQVLSPLNFELVVASTEAYAHQRRYDWLLQRMLVDLYEDRLAGPVFRSRLREVLYNTVELERFLGRTLARLERPSP